MLLIDTNDTANFITLGINFDCWRSYLLEDTNTTLTNNIQPIIDELEMLPQFSAYIEEEYKRFIPNLYTSYDFLHMLTQHMKSDDYHIMYRGNISHNSYFESRSSICEVVHDMYLEFGIKCGAEYNVSFYFNKESAKKLLSKFTELITASKTLASLALTMSNIDSVYYFNKTWNHPELLLGENQEYAPNTKLYLVDDLHHCLQVRTIVNREIEGRIEPDKE